MRTLTLSATAGLLLLSACDCPPAWAPPDACDEDGTFEAEVGTWGPAPWDGVWWRSEENICQVEDLRDADPTILDESGAAVAIETYGLCERRGNPDGLEPGSYAFLGWEEVPATVHPGSMDLLLDPPLTFTVEPWGRDDDFTPEAVAGRTWELPTGEMSSCGIMPLVFTLVDENGSPYLRLGEPEDGEVDFELLWGSSGGHEGAADCSIMSGRASLSETGELTWDSEHEVWDEDPLIEAWYLYLHLGFNAEGDALAGGEADALFQSTEVSRLLLGHDDSLCGLFGQCQSCPDGSGDTCMALETFSAEGTLSDRTFAEDLPTCWDLMAAEDIPDWSCSSGGRAPGALAALLALVPLAMVGRRKG